MTAVENSARVRNQRALVEAIRVAISRACISLDLPKSTETTRAIVDALAQLSQVHRIELDLAVDPALGSVACRVHGGSDRVAPGDGCGKCARHEDPTRAFGGAGGR